MEPIVLSGIILTLLLLSLMLSKKKKLHADRFLILYLLFAAIHQVYFYINFSGLFQDSPWLLLAKGGYLLQAPLFFLYVYALIRNKPLSSIISILVVAPFTAYVITFLYYYFFGFEGHEVTINDGWLYIDKQLSIPWAMFVWLFLLIEPFFLVWFYVLLRNYRRRLSGVNKVQQVNINWLGVLFYIWLILTVLLMPMSMLSIGNNLLPINFLETAVALAYMVFLFIMGYYGFKQTAVFSDLELKESPVTRVAYERSGLSSQQAIDLHTKLLAIMKEKKPYLNGELSARELASDLGISMNYLSQILSKEQNQNFFDFVNSYRVSEVKEKMQNPEFRHFTLLAIALESGFNSKTSFNTVFKKFTGQTPSQYYRSVVNR